MKEVSTLLDNVLLKDTLESDKYHHSHFNQINLQTKLPVSISFY